MCPWSDVVPEDVEARESPRAHYAKVFVHCLSFPRHCAFQLHTGPGFLHAHGIHLPPLAFFFFFVGLFSSLSFCPRVLLPSADT